MFESRNNFFSFIDFHHSHNFQWYTPWGGYIFGNPHINDSLMTFLFFNTQNCVLGK